MHLLGFSDSKQFDKILLTTKKHLNIYDNEISTVIDKYLQNIAIKEKEYQIVFKADESDYCKIGTK